MADKEHVRQVIAAIEADPAGFDMETYAGNRFDADENICGTTLCIGGHAAVLGGAEIRRVNGYPKFFVGDEQVNPHEMGVDYLELTDEEFWYGSDGEGLFYVNKHEAMRRLKELASLDG